MDEMISTEREYVRSLSYIIQHYFPEMERLDLPQDLRGKRTIIFGNVEKLWDFHSQYFLKDLESCAHCPLSISSCFLRHVSHSDPEGSSVHSDVLAGGQWWTGEAPLKFLTPSCWSSVQEDQFGMYALYSKNKPQSDALLSSHGNEFFKVRRQTAVIDQACQYCGSHDPQRAREAFCLRTSQRSS